MLFPVLAERPVAFSHSLDNSQCGDYSGVFGLGEIRDLFSRLYISSKMTKTSFKKCLHPHIHKEWPRLRVVRGKSVKL